MRSFNIKNSLWLGVAVFSVAQLAIVGRAQQMTRPLLQDIQVVSQSSGDFDQQSKVKKTSDVAPVLADVSIPGNSGVLIETLAGKPVIDSFADSAFNPASNVKIATAYAVLKSFSPDYRFMTNVWTDGVIDRSTGTLNGNLYVSGRDPIFGFAHAVTIAEELNKLGVRSITGSLIVSDGFVMNYSSSTSASSNVLFSTLAAEKRSAAAGRAWDNHLLYSGRLGEMAIPGVVFAGNVSVGPMTANLKLLFSHESVPLREILKVNLSYSNNFLSEKLGELVGGPYAIAQIVRQGVGIPAEEFSLQTASGLGINRVTPRAMMRLLRAFRGDLAKRGMTFVDVMPVAGIDRGTLEGRFASGMTRGSVVGKTGTLGATDAGVSSLAGEIYTSQGPVLFVIFNQRGSVQRFRAFQNSYVNMVLDQFGGPAPIKYSATNFESRLAATRITYPDRFRNAE